MKPRPCLIRVSFVSIRGLRRFLRRPLSMKQSLRLVQIAHDGVPVEELGSLPAVAMEMCTATVSLYRRVGFNPPWIGYLALSGPEVVGTCSFTSQPHLGKVEIAYFTFPQFEGRGMATSMARALIEIAGTTGREIQVTPRRCQPRTPSCGSSGFNFSVWSTTPKTARSGSGVFRRARTGRTWDRHLERQLAR
jgi:ribosomal-protein-alanine N-acetyltransferase